ncbi:MAG TPA: glycosyltransferase, partial [bacterium]|nr:glycosyltransferase [bacterium]
MHDFHDLKQCYQQKVLYSINTHAKGEIIIQTDADCVIPKSWISGMMRRFDD